MKKGQRLSAGCVRGRRYEKRRLSKESKSKAEQRAAWHTGRHSGTCNYYAVGPVLLEGGARHCPLFQRRQSHASQTASPSVKQLQQGSRQLQQRIIAATSQAGKPGRALVKVSGAPGVATALRLCAAPQGGCTGRRSRHAPQLPRGSGSDFPQKTSSSCPPYSTPQDWTPKQSAPRYRQQGCIVSNRESERASEGAWLP